MTRSPFLPFSLILMGLLFLFACGEPATTTTEVEEVAEEIPEINEVVDEDGFKWMTEKFADVKILQYQIPGFDRLSVKQKELVYYLTQAGLAGRDIMWDMNYRHNLSIRKAIEAIFKNYKGDRTTADWKAFEVYAKRVWFSNGIHHHYSNDKFKPEFSPDFFAEALKSSGGNLSKEAIRAIFDPGFDNKKVNKDESKGLVKGSAVNFYDPDITEEEVDAYYAKLMKNKDPKRPVSYGLNSKVVRNADGTLSEKVWKVGGMYSEAIEEIIKWLDKAVSVAENKAQGDALKLLIKYYQTGDLKIWDKYNIAWTNATEGDIDYIHSFIEVYNDPKGYKGSFENIVQIKDFDASERMAVVAENAQWFEDNSTIMDEHKKKKVVGISYKVVAVAGEAGDASPATPIGVNLPNANWIRKEHGSKSVSLGNIIEAYDKSGGTGSLKEFANDEEEMDRVKKYGQLAGKMSTALHEVIGHASGQINDGVGTPKETLKNYASTIEEARADLVALYYILDQKMVDMGLMESLEVGKAEYDIFMLNGLMTQLKRIEPGNNIEESHMRNRALIANWAYKKGEVNNVVSMSKKNGKTYININDYEALRVLFGDLLREIQRITSEGDYAAAQELVEGYGVKVDPVIHKEVLDRNAKLKTPPYGGFINPVLVPVVNDGKIVDVKIEYPNNFTDQMLQYGEQFSFLPEVN